MTGQFNANNNKRSRAIASGLARNVHIGSFKIGKNETNDMWYLIINQQRLIGTEYPSQDHAVSTLHGLFTGKGGSTAGMNAVIAQMIARGTGVIEADAAIGTATISGPTSLTAGSVGAYSVSFDGGATDATYSWSIVGGGGGAAATPADRFVVNPNMRTGGIGSSNVKCVITSASSADSPVEVTLGLTTTGQTQSSISSTGVANTSGVLSANQTINSSVFDQLGLRNIVTVQGTSIGLYFWTAYARDKFKSLNYFAIDSVGINPINSFTTTDVIVLNSWSETVDATYGFGLILNSAANAEIKWTASLVSGSVDLEWTEASGAMTIIQQLAIEDFNISNNTAADIVASVNTKEIIEVDPDEIVGDPIVAIGPNKGVFEPQVYHGSYAAQYGASAVTSGSNNYHQFDELSGGSNLSDRAQGFLYWSKYQIQVSDPSASQSSSYFWSEYYPYGVDETQRIQRYRNKLTDGSDKELADGDYWTYKVFEAAPLNNRRERFTSSSSHGNTFGNSISNISGPHWLSMVNGLVNASTTTILEYRVSAIHLGIGARDGLMKWLDNNGKMELWSPLGTSAITTLTHSVGPSDHKMNLLRDDGVSFDVNTTYELRYT